MDGILNDGHGQWENFPGVRASSPAAASLRKESFKETCIFRLSNLAAGEDARAPARLVIFKVIRLEFAVEGSAAHAQLFGRECAVSIGFFQGADD
jgi:hypothetical protein